MPAFRLVSDFEPTGDQPQAIEKLVEGLERGQQHQTLLGVTGSGKTFTMANVIARWQRPTLVIAPNKTLAAQLCSEFKEFFPDNAVEYFVSYYDYYQPEAYIPRTDTYIEKDADINEEIDKLRHAATRALFERRDVVIVASVSCIYGLGEPEEYQSFVLTFRKGEALNRDRAMRRLVDMQYERNDMNLTRGQLPRARRHPHDHARLRGAGRPRRVLRRRGGAHRRARPPDRRGPGRADARRHLPRQALRHLAGQAGGRHRGHRGRSWRSGWRSSRAQGKLLEAPRLEERTHYDLEMLREAGYCAGIENYSRHLARRAPGSTPWTLLDYFPDDFLMFIDESHMSMPQMRGMYHGDRSRKQTLVDYGFRLPSALDNRPLNFEEFEEHINQVVFVSATPGPYEYEHSEQVVEQIIRPTGLLDPAIEVKPTKGQIDDLIEQIRQRVERGERVLVTTLTKKMAEDLADYLTEMGVKDPLPALRDRDPGAGGDPARPAPGRLRRGGGHQPAARGPGPAGGEPGGHPGRRQGGLPALRATRSSRPWAGPPATSTARSSCTPTPSPSRCAGPSTRPTGAAASRWPTTRSTASQPQGIRKAIRDITDRVRKVAEERAVYRVAGPSPRTSSPA